MLLDTSGLLCLHHKPEPFHDQARMLYKQAHIRLTHSYVLAEFVALATIRRLPRIPALTYINDLLENPDIETIWVDETLHREAMTLLLARQDKTYSLCDAVSFVLMRRRNITEGLTTDHHFEQEGFRRLLGEASS
jgi:predicted nucleic acid-binding protein